VEPYNSCVYQAAYYAETLSVLAPKVRATYPDVKFYGSENMLEIEAGTDGQYFFSQAIVDNAAALKELDLWAVHGYSDGAAPTASSKMSQLWAAFQTKYAKSNGKPVWMTETSGYDDDWNNGPMNVALAIYSALAYGDISAWVWWQGSQSDVINDYDLMVALGQKSKRYFVHKQFARYIRPGARRVQITSDDQEVFVTAFEHAAMGSLTVVAINSATADKTLTLSGSDLPADYQMIRTSATEDAVDLGTTAGTGITLPARSITTLVHGAYREADVPNAAGGAGGRSNASGGSAGSNVTTGGTNAAGGVPGNAGSGTDAKSGDSGGCGCRVADAEGPRSANFVLLGALALGLGRRRFRASGDGRISNRKPNKP
jgi:MYXO-CTERM domain-containing protein